MIHNLTVVYHIITNSIEWYESAAKHGVSREDAMHAMANVYFHRAAFEEPRIAGATRPDLFLGPPRQMGGPLLEIMA